MVSIQHGAYLGTLARSKIYLGGLARSKIYLGTLARSKIYLGIIARPATLAASQDLASRHGQNESLWH